MSSEEIYKTYSKYCLQLIHGLTLSLFFLSFYHFNFYFLMSLVSGARFICCPLPVITVPGNSDTFSSSVSQTVTQY
jgi:hypothetical protein